MTESKIDFLIIFFVARFERNLILRVNVKKKRTKESRRNYCAQSSKQFYLLMNTEVLDQNGDVYFMLKNKSFFVHTKCLRF